MDSKELKDLVRRSLREIRLNESYRCVCGNGAGMSGIHGCDTPGKCRSCCKGKGGVKPDRRDSKLKKEEKKKNYSTQDDAPKSKGKSAAQCDNNCKPTYISGCAPCGTIGGGKSKENPFNTGTGPTKPTTNEEKTCCDKDWHSICCRKIRFGKDSSNSKDRMAKLAGLKNEGDEGKEFTKEELMNEGPELWTILGSLMGIIGAAGITGQLQAMAEDPAIAEKYPKLEKVFSMLAKVGGAVGSGIK